MLGLRWGDGRANNTKRFWELAAKNLRRILRHPVGIIRDDPDNIMAIKYLHCFFRILRFKKFGGFNYSLNALMRASAHPRLPRPITNRG